MMKRVFVAIPIQPEILIRFRGRMPEHETSGLRWISDETAHLTLAFLGNLEDHHVDLVSNMLLRVVTAPFEIEITAVEMFPSRRKPRAVALTVADANGHLVRLHKAVGRELGAWSPQNPRPFRPHITLARTRSKQRPAVVSETAFADMLPYRVPVTCFSLYSSITAPDRAYYSVLRHFPLNGCESRH